MKRKLMAAFLLAGILSGCASETAEKTVKPPEAEPDELVTIVPDRKSVV